MDERPEREGAKGRKRQAWVRRSLSRRDRVRQLRRIPLRIILPNLVTLLALCLGLTAIRFAFEGRFQNAVVSIIAAAILDGLDGRLARALESTSRFGAELDSLADFVDFGVAPALVLYFWSLYQIQSLGWFAALVFAIACALRLARFNVMLDDAARPAWASRFFMGMPAPAGAIVALMPLYLNLSVVEMPNDHAFVPLEIFYVLFVAFLMVSRIPHFSGKQIGRVPREYVLPVLFGVVVALLLLATYPMEMLIALSLGYMALVPVAMRRRNSHLRADAAAAHAGAAKPAAPTGIGPELAGLPPTPPASSAT